MTAHSITVNLGSVADGSVAPAIRAIVERGAQRRPHLAAEPGRIRLRFLEGWPAVLIVLGDRVIVCDNETAPVDVEITATLPDLIALITTPLARGVPNPIRREGRAALSLLRGRVRVEGLRTTARRLLQLLSPQPTGLTLGRGAGQPSTTLPKGPGPGVGTRLDVRGRRR